MPQPTTIRESRINAIVSEFVRSEYFGNWSAEQVESGGYARNGSDARDRYDRCYAAASDGADGSTHRERIDDMRSAFADWLNDRRRQGKLHFAADNDRLATAVADHFDRLEAWHQQNGSLDQQVG